MFFFSFFYYYFFLFILFFFFFNDTATTEIYTLSLHDALPISGAWCGRTQALHIVPNPAGSPIGQVDLRDRKSTRLNSSHVEISYAVFCLKKKKKTKDQHTAKKKKTKKRQKK